MITLTPEQQQDVARRFQKLATDWDETTHYRSNIHALRNHPVFHDLVALGEPAIPLVLAELKREPNVSWFHVLATISGENPVPSEAAGHIGEMARCWLEWGRRRGYIV